MRHGFTLLLLAAMFGLAAALNPAIWIRAGLVYTSVSFLYVSLGYLRLGSAIFRKNPRTGQLSIGIILFLLPYLLLTWLSGWLHRLTSRERPIDRLSDGIFIGRRLTGPEFTLLVERGVVAILDLTAEFSEPAAIIRHVPNYRNLPLLDASAPPVEILREASAWIHSMKEEGPIYIHCALGHGRTGLVAGAYLLASGSCQTAAEAMLALQQARPGLDLNPSQLARLRELECQPPLAAL